MDADDAITNLDSIDERAQVGLSERNFAAGDVLAHQRPEALDFPPVDTGRRRLAFDPLHYASGPIAIGLDVGKAYFQNLVEISDAVFDQRVAAPELSSSAVFASRDSRSIWSRTSSPAVAWSEERPDWVAIHCAGSR